MSVRTVKKILKPSFSLSSTVIDFNAVIPNDMLNKKIPITINIDLIDETDVNADDEYNDSNIKDISKTNLICYHYSIPSRIKSQEVVSSALLDTSNDYIRDITRQLSTLICKKYQHPCYVSWSDNGNNNSPSIDHLMIIKECVNFLKNEISK